MSCPLVENIKPYLVDRFDRLDRPMWPRYAVVGYLAAFENVAPDQWDWPKDFDVTLPKAGITVNAHRVWTSASPGEGVIGHA